MSLTIQERSGACRTTTAARIRAFNSIRTRPSIGSGLWIESTRSPEQVKETGDEKRSNDIDSVFNSCKFQFTRDANVHASVVRFLTSHDRDGKRHKWSLLDDRAINTREG